MPGLSAGGVELTVEPSLRGFGSKLQGALKGVNTKGPGLTGLENSLTKPLSGLTSKLSGFSTRIDGALKTLGQKGTFTSAAISKLGIATGETGNLLKYGLTAGVSVAGAAIAGFALAGVHSFTDLAEKVRKFKEISGASAEDSSRLISAMGQLGISAQAGARGFFLFGKAIAGHEQTLNKLGIQVARNKDGNVDMIQSLFRVSDAYLATEDPAKRAQIAAAAFGRGGAALIPILERGRTGLQAFFDAAKGSHQILSDSDLNKALNYQISIRRMKDAFTGLSREVGEGLVPALGAAADIVAQLVRGVDHIVGPLGKILGPIARSAFPKDTTLSPEGIAKFEKGLGFSPAEVSAYSTALDGVSGSASGAGDSINDLSTEVGGLSQAQQDSAAATKAQIYAINRLGPGVTHVFGDTKHQVLEWQRSLSTALNFVANDLSSLGNDAKLSSQDVVKGFTSSLDEMIRYRQDMDALIARHAPADLLKQLTDLGEGGKTTVHALATANDSQWNTITRKWRQARDQAPKTGKDIRKGFLEVSPIKIDVRPQLNRKLLIQNARAAKQDLLDQLGSVAAGVNTAKFLATNVQLTAQTVRFESATGHAAGGPTVPFRPYRVDERGPEPIVYADRPGYVVTHAEALAAVSAAASGATGGSSAPAASAGPSVVWTGNVINQQPRDTGETVTRALKTLQLLYVG